jgi:hypothetical protein
MIGFFDNGDGSFRAAPGKLECASCKGPRWMPERIPTDRALVDDDYACGHCEAEAFVRGAREQILKVADGYPLDWEKFPPLRAATGNGAVWLVLRAAIEEIGDLQRRMRPR